MATAYSKRMSELQQKTTDSNARQLDNVFGLQRRPQSTSNTSVPTKPEGPDESYKDNDFYRNIDFHQNNDPHFKTMMGEYTSMVMGLKEQVNQGYMPMPIAKQRLMDYLHDSSVHREGIEPMVQDQQNQQATVDAGNAQIQMAIQQMQGNGQQQSPNGQEATQPQPQPQGGY